MEKLINLLSTNTDLLWAALVSAVVSTGVSYWFKRRETVYKAKVEYEYEQRKKLRQLIGRYHGRLLNAANSMNYRLWNLYKNWEKGWLDVDGDYANIELYYFRSSVYRFLNVCTLIRQLESEAILLDARIAQKDDFVFLNYAAALNWVMTDAALIDGLQYDVFYQTDHFFSDQFRQYCDKCLINDGFISIDEFSNLLSEGDSLMAVLQYFDGLTQDENRFRWDRLVSFHLLLMAFINSFGYSRQYTSQGKFIQVAKQVRNLKVLENLEAWLPRHDLERNSEVKKIIRAIKAVKKEDLLIL